MDHRGIKPLLSVAATINILMCLTASIQGQGDRHVVPCGIQQKACVCRPDADECEFTLVVNELQTFTSYMIIEGGNSPENEQPRLPYKLQSGSPYYISGTGVLLSSRNRTEASCFTDSERFSEIHCTEPQAVDGKTYRSFISVNGLIPGPTLIVNEGQRIIANVINNLLTEGISIHWHGQDMRNTPWMDGALLVTQCPINPEESFQYYFKASPTGTFWYHSHRITQRTDGLFGALIIRENPERQALIEREVNALILDDPALFTVNLHDWAELSAIGRFTFVQGDLGYYLGKPSGDVPLPPNELKARGIPQYNLYDATVGPDGTVIGEIPFWSALINGKGRHRDVPYNNTRLEIFSVFLGNSYRFRLIGGQGHYPYRFSIDEHTLTVIAIDGALILPVEVQFIILHTGERYDFVLNAQRPRMDTQDYWIRFETLEVNVDSNGPPYRSLGNAAEGILHYVTSSQDELPRSTEYENIKNNSIPYDNATCEARGGCVALNCPFRAFHPSYNTVCRSVHELRLLEPTAAQNLPSGQVDPECDNCELFFNINSDQNALNGLNFLCPPAPLLTQRKDIPSSDFCELNLPCDSGQCAQDCVHVRDVTAYNKTIRFVLTSVGLDVAEGKGSAHPMHLHGHHFHVAKIGYGSYDENGFFTRPSTDIICDDPLCSKPRWNGTRPTFEIGSRTVTKDTIIVPPGGYVVIHFIANNPGYWFMHCHIEADLLEGMAVVINELSDRQIPPPDGINKCGNFNTTQTIANNQKPGNSECSNKGFKIASNIVLVACLGLYMYIFIEI